MAELKKYLDQAGLEALVAKIKSEDDAHLAEAKAYCDSKDKLFESAGAANTVKTELEGKIAEVQGAVDAEKSRAEGVEAGLDTAVKAAQAAAEAAQAAADKAQGEVDAVEELVGVIPEGYEAKTIAEYAKELADNVAANGYDDAALQARVKDVEDAVAAIEEDYLVEADKEALQGSIDGVAGTVSTLSQTHATDKAALEASIQEAKDAVATEKSRAEGIESGIDARLKVVEGDYLKSSDKTELTQAIATAKQEAIETVLGEGEIAESFDTLKEVAEWILSDTTGAAGLQTKVSTLEGEMDDVQADVEQAKKDIDAVEAAVATKAEAQALADEKSAREEADADLDERLQAVEAQLGDGDGSVADLIADAKQEAIDSAVATAADDATTKANAAESAAKAHADSLNTEMNARVDALEAIDHEHANKALLDTYTQTEADLADAVAKKHEHANATELAKIADGDVAKWNAAEQNAKDYADGLNTAMSGRVAGIDGRVTAVEGAVATKAEDADLDAAVERITAVEGVAAANAAAIAGFTAIPTTDIDALFA